MFSGNSRNDLNLIIDHSLPSLFPHLVKRFIAEMQVAMIFRPGCEYFIDHFILEFAAGHIHDTSAHIGHFPCFPGDAFRHGRQPFVH